MVAGPRPFLDIQGLSVDFKTRHGTVNAVSDVHLSLEKGEVLGIVGESGSGKSVTAYSVIGLLDKAGTPTAGCVTFDGINISRAEESSLRDLRGREISMIFQNPRAALNPIRPVGQQIQDVLLHHGIATRQTARSQAIEMLEKVRIVDPQLRYESYPFQLSGGMCQRVMIAIALACDPRLLIADEPTTGLDVTTQKSIMDLISELTQERNMAVVLITHDLGMAANYCDRVSVMEKGVIVESASVETLFSNPDHPYTKKLIAASPQPDSTLELLAPGARPFKISDDVLSYGIKQKGTDNILEIKDLIKDFPIQHIRRGLSPNKEILYGKKKFRAVDNISFVLKRGESIGIVGESGCGKSTTSNIISRLIDPTSGDILFNGVNITAFRAQTFARRPERKKIQMVFQDSTDSLNPRYTAKDIISEPLKRLLELHDKDALNEKVEKLAERVGLPPDLLNRFPHQLSGGQKARVGIARAIAIEPELLVLDEPTSALDVSVQAVVLQLLERLKNELGLSYIFVSHDLNVVRLLCESVIVMNRGKIIETGRSDIVLKNPTNSYTKELVAAIPNFKEKLT